MKPIPSEDLMTEILNLIAAPIQKEKIDPIVYSLSHQIQIQSFSQIDIFTIHFQMRNGLTMEQVFQNYKFLLNPQLLEEIQHLATSINSTQENFHFLYVILVHNFIAWEILFEQSTSSPPVDELLKTILLLESVDDETNTTIDKIFFQIFVTFISKDNNYKIYELLPYFYQFLQTHRDQKLFILILQHISKNSQDPRFYSFLKEFNQYLFYYTSFFSEESIFKILPYLQSSFEDCSYSALKFLKFSTDVLSNRCIQIILPALCQAIIRKLQTYDPIILHLNENRPDHFSITKNKKNNLGFLKMSTNSNEIDMYFSIEFPAILDLNSFFEKHMLKILTVVSKIFEKFSSDFVDAYIDNFANTGIINFDQVFGQTSMNHSHFYNIFIALLYICNQFTNLNLGTTTSGFFFNQLIFNPDYTIFGYSNSPNDDFPILNTLRFYSLDCHLSDNGKSIDNTFNIKYVLSVPLFVAEIFGRLANCSSLFASKIISYPKLIKTISGLTLAYQNLEFSTHDENKKNQIRIARVSIFTALTHLLSDSRMLELFFNDPLFINTISVFLFEEPVRPFVMSSLTSYLSKPSLALNPDLPLIMDHILENLNLQLPGKRQILLLKDLLTLLNRGFSYQRSDLDKFSQTCLILCHSLAAIGNSSLAKEIFEQGISFLSIMTPYFKMTNLEIDALMYGLSCFNDEQYVRSLYPKFICLLAGKRTSPSSPTFFIMQPQVLKLLLQTYSQPTILETIVDYISQLCNFARTNLILCAESGIDLVLLSYLEKAKKYENYQESLVKKILNLYSLVSSRYTTPQSCLKYISLLSPLNETDISKYQLTFIQTLNSIIVNSFNEPSSSFLLDTSNFFVKRVPFSKKQNPIFSITFWIYIEPDISDNHPSICSIWLTPDLAIGAFVSNGQLFIYHIFDNVLHHQSISGTLSVHKWHFIAISFDFSYEKGTLIYYRIDCEKKQLLLFPLIRENLNCQSITVELGEHEAKTKPLLTPSRLTQFGLFEGHKIEEFIQIYELGIRFNDPKNVPLDPLFYKCDFEEFDQSKTSRFTDVFIEQCGVNCILPLFLQTDMAMDGKPFTLSLETIITLLNDILSYSFYSQLSFSQSKGFNIIAELLTQRWTKYFTFKHYQQFFQLLLSIQCEQLQQQFFDEVLTNFTFLMQLDSELHLRILKHWSHSLFPSFKLIAMNFSSFEDLAAIIRLFYWDKPVGLLKVKYANIRPSNLNVAECRIYLFNILFQYAKEYFEMDMFISIIANCVSSAELVQVGEFVNLLINIFSNSSVNIPFSVENDYLIQLVQYYMKYPNDDMHILILKLLNIAHKSNRISSEFYELQLNAIISILPTAEISETLRTFLNNELLNDPYLINLCFYVSLQFNDFSYCTELLLHNENFKNDLIHSTKFWGIWILCIMIFVKPEMTFQLLNCLKSNIFELLIQYDLLFEESVEFEDKLTEFAINNSHSIDNFLLICQRLIAFSFKSTSLFKPTDFSLFENENSKRPQNDINQKSSIKFLQTVFTKPLEKPKIGFFLKFNEKFEWKHAKLSLTFLNHMENRFDNSFLAFDLLLCAFLQTTDFDCFGHLVAIHLNDKVLIDFETLLSYLEYHTIKNGKQIFLRSVPFANPFPIHSKYGQLIAQISPKQYIETIQKYYEEFNNNQSIIKNRILQAKHADISPLIEIATTQSRNFLNRQKFQNYLNLQSWNRLWWALSIERGPWHIESKEKIQILKRETSCSSFGFAPTLILNQVNCVQSSKVNSMEISKRGMIIHSQCAVLTVIGRNPADFYLFREMVIISISEGRRFEIPLDTLKFFFLRRNNGCQLFTDAGYSFHLEFPDDFLCNFIPLFVKQIKVDIPIQRLSISNKTFFHLLPYQKKWAKGKLSNYEYLLMLNHCAGRSFNDSQNYPFFPWILNSVTVKDDLRNFQKLQKSTPIENTTVLAYLNSFEPFKSQAPNDVVQFTNFNEIINFAKANNTEFIPELYSMPELFDQPGFALPHWIKSPFDMVFYLRKKLESQEISNSLHFWITQMFGDKSPLKLFDGEHPRKFKDNQSPKIEEIVEYQAGTRGKVIYGLCLEEKKYVFTFVMITEKQKGSEVNDVYVMKLHVGQARPAFRSRSTSEISHILELMSQTSDNLIEAANDSLKHFRDHSNFDLISKNNSNESSPSSNKGKDTLYNNEMSSINIKENAKIGSIKIPENEIVVSIDKKFIIASNDIIVYNDGLTDPVKIETESQYLTAIAADGPYIVAAGGYKPNVSLIRKSRVIQTIRLYGEALSCICVSSVFNIVAVGTIDSSVVICSATNGDLIRVISLSDYHKEQRIGLSQSPSFSSTTSSVTSSSYASTILSQSDNNTTCDASLMASKIELELDTMKTDEVNKAENENQTSNIELSLRLTPIKVLITPSWGFIVVYCTEVFAGLLKNIIMVFSINGMFIRCCEIPSKIVFWTSWSSAEGFDYLVYSTDTGFVYLTQVFKAHKSREIYHSKASIISAVVSRDRKILSILMNDGKIALIPIGQ